MGIKLYKGLISPIVKVILFFEINRADIVKQKSQTLLLHGID